MSKLRQKPPRSLKSFGVAGLLDEGCKVFYESIFGTKHIGRLSDLISARLKDSIVDELKLRALLLFTAFYGFITAKKDQEKVSVPISMECGIDKDRIAIGTSFVLRDGEFSGKDKFLERVKSGVPKGDLEKFAIQLLQHSHDLVIKIDKDLKKAELVSLLNIHGAQTTSSAENIDLIVFEAAPEEAPSAEYTELGDLDYPTLLREEEHSSGGTERDGDVIRIRGVTDKIKSEKTVVKGQSLARAEDSGTEGNEVVDENYEIHGEATEAESAEIFKDRPEQERNVVKGVREIEQDHIRVSGEVYEDQADEKIVVKGSTHEIEQDHIRVSGEVYEEQAEEKIIIEGSNLESNEAEPTYIVKGGKSELNKKGPVWRTKSTSSAVETESAVKESGAVFRIGKEENKPKEEFLKKIWPFKKKEVEAIKAGEEAAEAIEEPIAAEEEIHIEQDSVQEELERNSDALVSELEKDHLQEILNNARAEAEALRKELKSEKAKTWMEGLTSQVLSEKARLHELAKTLNSSIKQKEYSFIKKEQSLKEELRKKEELLRQKAALVERLKEQLAAAAENLQQMRGEKGSEIEDVIIKQKLEQTQKLLHLAKEENQGLAKKVDELRKLVSTMQASGKSRNPNSDELSKIKEKYERAERQAEEFKKSNQQLMAKLNESKRDKGSNSVALEDLKKRLEMATNVASMSRKETERLQGRTEALQKEEMRLKIELARSLEENKKLRIAKLQATLQRPGVAPQKPDKGSGDKSGSSAA